MTITTNPPHPVGPRPAGPRRVMSDVVTLTRRNLLHTVRLPGVLVLSATMPVIFILMFTFVFGGAIEGVLPVAAAGEYVNWLVPGLIAQFALFGGASTAAGLADDLASGTIERFRSLPMSRFAVLAGRTFSDVLRSSITMTLMLVVGIAVGFRWQTSVLGLLAGMAVALVFSYGLSWLMAVVGLVVRSAEAVQAAVYMVIFPLGFTSGVFVPTHTMPGWLEAFAANQPVTVAANALRGLMLGEGALEPGQTVAGQVGLTLIWAGVLTAGFAPLAVRAFSRPIP
jgi:ABC transporter DrrB family efflux protein